MTGIDCRIADHLDYGWGAHTPGPWRIVTINDDTNAFGYNAMREEDRIVFFLSSQSTRIYGSRHQSDWVADVGCCGEETRISNAMLIAAAPRMLAVLRRVNEMLDVMRNCSSDEFQSQFGFKDVSNAVSSVLYDASEGDPVED